MIDSGFWRGRKVFVTGHTGFKGSWLCLWLQQLGAEVTGYSLPPPTDPSLFEIARVSELVDDRRGDLRDGATLSGALKACKAEIVFHLAAQPIVRESYLDPIGTFETNVIGTARLLEAVRRSGSVRAAVVVTTDKCYENKEWDWGYREIDRLGGRDPYSSSKACAELVTSSYRDSFFSGDRSARIATARAGNVIGGGDWAKDRLVPDCIRALEAGEPIKIRHPGSIRPWQHVLEPLAGYMTLAERLFSDPGVEYAGAWNFGPFDEDARTVEWIVKRLCDLWGDGASYAVDGSPQPHEASCLKLDCSKAVAKLGWKPVWGLEQALSRVIAWNRPGARSRAACMDDIDSWMDAALR